MDPILASALIGGALIIGMFLGVKLERKRYLDCIRLYVMAEKAGVARIKHAG